MTTAAVRPTVRLRLTALYGGLFLLCGCLLLAVNYALVRSKLDARAFPVKALGQGPGVAKPMPGDEVPLLVVDGEPLTVEELRRRLHDETLDDLLVQSAQAMVLVAGLSVAVGWVVAGRVLKPLHEITAAARRLSEENLHERIALVGPEDELKELADTFDAMLGRLEEAFESQRRFVANASHELRTPLSIIRAELDVTLGDRDASPTELRTMVATVRDAIGRSERLVDSLLFLARSERGRVASEDLDLAEVVGEVVTQAAGEARRSEVSFELELAPAPIVGDALLVERLVANLVENAVRYNEAGGRVVVSTFRSGDVAVLRVANTGPKVPPEAVDGLFEPFRRLEGDRVAGKAGVGLGLSIVRSIVAAHNGTVTARARARGGMEVEARLPLR